MTFGSLFAGIGGLDLGLERAGMKCVWQVEIDDYCNKVLAKHWPNVRRHDDVRTFPTAGDWSADLICGGFPCQDISNAGRRAGIKGARSGLWADFVRIIRAIRPRFVLVENVAALLVRGLDTVLGDLAESGYSAEWDCLPACAFGAPHRRWRIFIVAYPNGCQQRGGIESERQAQGRDAHATRHGQEGNSLPDSGPQAGRRFSDGRRKQQPESGQEARTIADPSIKRLPLPKQATVFGTGRGKERRTIAQCDWWAVEPELGRVAHGVPRRVDRLRTLGNAVVPQIAEWIGQRIIEFAA